MNFSNTRVMNFEGAFRGLRNPLESWDKSDSFFEIIDYENDTFPLEEVSAAWIDECNKDLDPSSDKYLNILYDYGDWLIANGTLKQNDNLIAEVAYLGPNDLHLAQKLVRAGSSHRKFMRQIFVSVDITAPIYWWKELDQYRIGVVTNSTSTMHKLASTPITIDCFEIDDYNKEIGEFLENKLIPHLESLRREYNETKDKKIWKELIRLLPESWLQTRITTMNYENILSICSQRAGHKLTEWAAFIEWAKTLPYAHELIFAVNN